MLTPEVVCETPSEAHAVGRRLVVRGGDEDVAQPVAVRTDLGADPLLVDVEQTLLVDHLDGHRPTTVGDHHRPRGDRIGDVIEVTRGVPAAAEQIAVPAAVVIAVDERIAGVVVTVVMSIDVGLLERELPRPVVLRGMRAVRWIATRHVAERRRRETRHRRAHAERRRPAMDVVPVITARGGQQHRSGRERGF